MATVVERRRSLRGLIGRSGRAADDMLPWGVVVLDGVRHQAVSESGVIVAGTDIEVAGVQGGSLVVRPRAAAVIPAAQPAVAPESAAESALSATLEEFDFERLDRPET